jgi:anionic cell wall polymer biosynthesis LytR-Cps2A-Psr (LCP) family protein
MDTAAFSRAVDAVGGIEYDVPAEMHYDDPVQGLHIHLDKGRQTLDGKKAEGLLRYRSGYATGDLGRVDVRSRFLSELLSQVKEKMTAGAAAQLAAELAFSVTTDMSIYEISRFAAFLHGIAEENVNIKTISGSAVQNPKTGAWIYYALNREAALADINEYITPNGAEVTLENFDKNSVFTDDPHGENPYISKYYYSKIKKE